jgi:uncharacterized membrane protein
VNILIKWLGLNPDEYNQWEIRWAAAGPGLEAAVLVLLVPLALWFFWTSLARIRSPWRKVFLLLLRVLAFSALLLVLFRPELELRKGHYLKNSIAVLLDNSKSLSIKNFPDEQPRASLVRQAMEKNQLYFERLAKTFNVDFYFVSDRPVQVSSGEIATYYQPREPFTDFGRVFADLRKKYEDQSLKGVMLFSDGADLNQAPDEISEELRRAVASIDSPIHAFQTGSNDLFKDLAIEAVDAPDFGFVQQPVNLSVTVNASSIGNKNVSLVLKEGDNVLISKMIEIREGTARYPVDLQFTPRALGKRVYSLSLPLFAGESIASNNRREFQVKVIPDRIRVLHLNGRPSWDSRFLREVLVNNPKVDLLSFFILRTLGDDVAAPTTELSLIPFPSNLLFTDYLNSFDLVIFQNFKYSPFIEKKHLENVKAFVENGGAFLMIGGNLSFQGGEYERTAIEDLLPVSLLREKQAWRKDEIASRPVKGFLNHPILRLEKDDAANEKIWRSLPPLSTLNTGLRPETGAQVLVEDGKGGPVLAVAKKGRGRAALIASDSSWNWNFRRVGEGGSGRYYQRFWNNMVAWLSGDPATQVLQLETDREQYHEGDEVLIKGRVLKEDYQPAAGEAVTLTLRSPAGGVDTHAFKAGPLGEVAFAFTPEEEGFYHARAEVKRGKETLSAEAGFGVFGDTAEFQKPLVNPALLEKIAAISGGTASVLSAQTDLSGIHFENPEVLVKTRSKAFSLWDNWAAYGLIAGLLFLEWWLRRKSGLS